MIRRERHVRKAVTRWRAALLWGGVALAVAGPALGETLEFRQCVDMALRQNPDLKASQAQIAQAEGALRQAGGNRFPKLVASITATRSDDALNAFGLKLSQRDATFSDFGAGEFNPANPNVLGVAPYNLNHPDAVTNYNTRLELQIPVYNGGMIQGYVDQARAYVRAAQHGDTMARQQLIFHVLQAYEGVHAAQAYVKVATQAQAAAEAYLKTTESLFKQGVVVRSEVLTAQVNLENVKVQLEQARNGEATALDQLHLLLGLPLDRPLAVGAPVMPGLLEASVAQLQAQAVAGNPGVQALRQQLDGAAAGVKVARAAAYPHFNLMARQDWNKSTLGLDAPSYTVGGVLSWQLFDAGSTRGAVDRAEAGRGELVARLRQAEDGVRFQVRDAWRKASEAQRRVAARELAVSQAGEAQRLVSTRHANGVATMVEVLAAQAQLDKARADLVAARYDEAVQRAALRLAAGQLEADQF